MKFYKPNVYNLFASKNNLQANFQLTVPPNGISSNQFASVNVLEITDTASIMRALGVELTYMQNQPNFNRLMGFTE
jgi:hypothetical protein